MLAKTALLVLAALAASVSTAEAGVGNLNLAARVNPTIPKPPNLGAAPDQHQDQAALPLRARAQ